MNDKGPPADIELDAIGIGCGVSVLATITVVAIVLVAAALTGVPMAFIPVNGLPDDLQYLGFFLGVGAHVAIGYWTARASTQSPKLNVAILAVIFMVFGVLAIALRRDQTTWAAVLSTVCVVPAMLFGATLVANSNSRHRR